MSLKKCGLESKFTKDTNFSQLMGSIENVNNPYFDKISEVKPIEWEASVSKCKTTRTHVTWGKKRNF